MTQSTQRARVTEPRMEQRMISVVDAAVRTSSAVYLRSLRRCTRDPSSESVHDIRVAVRRLLVALEASTQGKPRKEIRALRRSLRRVLTATGPLRDTQVLLDLMRDRLADTPGCRVLYEKLEAEESVLKRRTRKVAATFPGSKEISKLIAVVVRPEHGGLNTALEAAYARTFRTLASSTMNDDRALHGARILSRELRYLLEIARPLAERAIDAQLVHLRELQTVVGTIHDLDALRQRLTGSISSSIPAKDRTHLSKQLWQDLRTLRKQCAATTADVIALHPVVIAPGADGPPHANIYLLRHAIAKPRDKFRGDDQTRPLTAKGRRKMERIARAIASLKLTPDIILTSPYVRANDTARILSRALSAQVPVRRCAWLAPAFSSAVAIASLATFIHDGKNVFVVGHEPALQSLAAKLTALRGGHEPLRKGGLCKIEFFSPDPKRHGTVAWTLTPKQLAI